MFIKFLLYNFFVYVIEIGTGKDNYLIDKNNFNSIKNHFVGFSKSKFKILNIIYIFRMK